MVQHLVLMLFAAPLFAMARVPATMLLRRQREGRVHVPVIIRPSVRLLLRTPAGLAWFVQFVVLWLWHTPFAFSAATNNPWIHAAQHASFLGVATWYWASILRGFGRGTRQATGVALLSLFMSALHSSVLGAFLALVQTPLYVVSHANGHVLTTLQDQQLAGLLMWVPGSVVYLLAAMLLARRLASESRGREHPPSEVPQSSSL